MNSQGLIGFRIQEQDKLAYNQSASRPDMLGLKILNEIRAVDDWDAVKKRTEELTPVAETHRLDYFDSYPIAEIRRHFPDIASARPPTDYHDLYQPLAGRRLSNNSNGNRHSLYFSNERALCGDCIGWEIETLEMVQHQLP